jgi:hypothetical protein
MGGRVAINGFRFFVKDGLDLLAYLEKNPEEHWHQTGFCS